MRDLVYATVHGIFGSIASVLNIYRRTILCLHSVSNGAAHASRLSIDIDVIRSLVVAARHQGVPIVSLDNAMDRLARGDLAPFIALTFDDGYRDNYDIFFPLARALDLPFTIFVTSGLVDRTSVMWWDVLERLDATRERGLTGRGLLDDPELVRASERLRRVPLEEQAGLLAELQGRWPALGAIRSDNQVLTWAMLREMQASGLLTVGAHTATHRMLSGLSAPEIRVELDGSRRRIGAKLGVMPDYLAYPFGQPHEVGPLASGLARDLEYRAAFTTEARPLDRGDDRDLFRLPRILLSNKVRSKTVALSYVSGIAARAQVQIRRRAAR